MSGVIKFQRRRRGFPISLLLVGCAVLVFVITLEPEKRLAREQVVNAPRVLNGGGAWKGGNRRKGHSIVQISTAASRGTQLVESVTHIRDGDTIVVGLIPIRIANLDCAERGSKAGDRATRQITGIVKGVQLRCTLEGRRSYDREVGVCSLPDGRDVGETLIAGGYCQRWRG